MENANVSREINLMAPNSNRSSLNQKTDPRSSASIRGSLFPLVPYASLFKIVFPSPSGKWSGKSMETTFHLADSELQKSSAKSHTGSAGSGISFPLPKIRSGKLGKGNGYQQKQRHLTEGSRGSRAWQNARPDFQLSAISATSCLIFFNSGLPGRSPRWVSSVTHSLPALASWRFKTVLPNCDLRRPSKISPLSGYSRWRAFLSSAKKWNPSGNYDFQNSSLSKARANVTTKSQNDKVRLEISRRENKSKLVDKKFDASPTFTKTAIVPFGAQVGSTPLPHRRQLHRRSLPIRKIERENRVNNAKIYWGSILSPPFAPDYSRST
jgi:hypothetical protein